MEGGIVGGRAQERGKDERTNEFDPFLSLPSLLLIVHKSLSLSLSLSHQLNFFFPFFHVLSFCSRNDLSLPLLSLHLPLSILHRRRLSGSTRLHLEQSLSRSERYEGRFESLCSGVGQSGYEGGFGFENWREREGRGWDELTLSLFPSFLSLFLHRKRSGLVSPPPMDPTLPLCFLNGSVTSFFPLLLP